MTNRDARPLMAIACGGTGGHLFPGIAVAEQLLERGCDVTLLVSPKEVDQQVVKNLSDMEVVTLPAVGLNRGKEFAFVRGLTTSYRAAKKLFESRCPQATLAMGGFTSAPPILAAKSMGTATFLHESNTIPGRANRWLSWVVNQAFVGFPMAGQRLNNRNVTTTGTPVRPRFHPRDAEACRQSLGLDPQRPVVAVIGGSQGASGINDLVINSLPLLADAIPELQWFHLAGPNEVEKVRQAYAKSKFQAIVHSFYDQMDLVLGAATAAISRAGASSLAELAAVRLPAILIPYPAATDDHQFYNARSYAQAGAARMLDQHSGTPESLRQTVLELLRDPAARHAMQRALAKWHAPRAAQQIADTMMATLEQEPVATVAPYSEPHQQNA